MIVYFLVLEQVGFGAVTEFEIALQASNIKVEKPSHLFESRVEYGMSIYGIKESFVVCRP